MDMLHRAGRVDRLELPSGGEVELNIRRKEYYLNVTSMNIPDPPWKKPTRPCPFYSQGRCVFAESCGFLHDVKVKRSRPDSHSSRDSTSSMGPFVKPPLTITVHSPITSCSPPRSPRMASLLSALQDIIGSDSSEGVEFPVLTGEVLLLDASHLPPSGADGVCGGKSQNVHINCAMNPSPPPCKTGHVDNEEDFRDETSCSINKDMPSDAASPPGLLSPVQIGSVPPIPFPHAGLGVALARDDSDDSGYAETWVGPTPFSLSPPQSNQPNSTLDLLSSPFGSPFFSRILAKKMPPSPGHQYTSLPVHCDSIDIDSPPSFVNCPPHISPAHASPPCSLSSGQGGAEGADPSTTVLDGLECMLVKTSSESLLFPLPPGEVHVLKTPLSMASYERPADPQLAVDKNLEEDSSGTQEKDASYVVEETVRNSSISGQLTLAETSYVEDPSPSLTPPVNTNVTSPLSPAIALQSPISIRNSLEDEEFDYEALYQSLIMSPEDVASKRLSSVSLPSPRGLPSRTASTHLPRRSTSAPVDIPDSTVDGLPWSCHRDLGITPVLLSDNATRTSSPLSESISSGPSEADASAPSVNRSPVSLSGSDFVAHASPSASSSKHSRFSAIQSPPRSAPIPGPSSAVSSSLNGRHDPELVKSEWNRVSTSRKVPFGFRSSLIQPDGGPLSPVALKTRKRPSALTFFPPVPLIDRFEMPGSARSWSTEASQSKPSWPRPLHLSRPSETISVIHCSTPYREPLTSAINKLSDPSNSQRRSLSSSPLHSSQYDPIHSTRYPRYYIPSLSPHDTPRSAPISHIETWRNFPHLNAESSVEHGRSTSCPPEQPSTTGDDASENGDPLRTFTQRPVPLPPAQHALRSESSRLSLASSSSAVPELNLMFAIASDNAKSVHDVLEHARADPNEPIGPQSALAFALTNERLSHKLDIVKALLAHGADPAALRNPELNPPLRSSSGDDAMPLSPPLTTTREAMDPATRYYVSRADALQTRQLSALLQQTSFRSLDRVRYDIVGQDQVFEQLFAVLHQHSRAHSVSPLVFLLCGPSGHGKSFLARSFGSLLGVPTHTVNVTTLRSTHDLWDSYSMSPYEEMSSTTLSQFLLENEGKRCVVVIDEIEKVEEPKFLHSLLMPWELGRYSPQAGHRHIDVRQVIWLGTSNIGQDLVFEFCDALSGRAVTREEYQDLVRLLRPKISKNLGASLCSRVTTLLPFVPFNETELMAIATEAFYTLGGENAPLVSSDNIERVSRQAIESYIPEEGARSLHRAVTSLLVDIPELLE